MNNHPQVKRLHFTVRYKIFDEQGEASRITFEINTTDFNFPRNFHPTSNFPPCPLPASQFCVQDVTGGRLWVEFPGDSVFFEYVFCRLRYHSRGPSYFLFCFTSAAFPRNRKSRTFPPTPRAKIIFPDPLVELSLQDFEAPPPGFPGFPSELAGMPSFQVFPAFLRSPVFRSRRAAF